LKPNKLIFFIAKCSLKSVLENKVSFGLMFCNILQRHTLLFVFTNVSSARQGCVYLKQKYSKRV